MREFDYLVNEYGFEVRKAPFKYENPYSVYFKNSGRFVYAEGASYGYSFAVRLGRVGFWSKVREEVWLATFMFLRAPELLEPRFPEKRGQLEEMKFTAAALKRCAADFLIGDLSALSQLLRLQEDRSRMGRAAHEEAQMTRAFMQASDAFHGGKFELAVRLLEPHSEHLGKAQKALLNLAKKRTAAKQ